MALAIDKAHTALLAMDFENDIVHEDGAFKDFGFAAMVKQNDVLTKTAKLLDTARRVGVKVIYVVVKFRSGYPERPAKSIVQRAKRRASEMLRRRSCWIGTRASTAKPLPSIQMTDSSTTRRDFLVTRSSNPSTPIPWRSMSFSMAHVLTMTKRLR